MLLFLGGVELLCRGQISRNQQVLTSTLQKQGPLTLLVSAPWTISFVLSLAALGVVYGDIGTSPLYALRECFHGAHAIDPSPANIIGVLSLILRSLIIVNSIKYLVFVRSDHRTHCWQVGCVTSALALSLD